MENARIGFFEKYLTVWVLICMVIGVSIGKLLGFIPNFLNRFEFANINIVIAVLIWLMIYPMMLKIDFTSIKNVGKKPKGLYVTWIVNWLIKPFTMFGIASLFFLVIYKSIMPDIGRDYLAGAVLLGAAPCTAMVFVWSSLTKGDPAYTLVQVATNDLIILVAFVPIVALLLGIGGFTIPWLTLFLSVCLFVIIPLALGIITRNIVIKKKGIDYLNNKVITKFSKVTTIGLLLTLVIIFSLQADLILSNPLHILLIGIPLIIQTFLIFFIAYGICRLIKLPHPVAGPAGMIGASNFFELAVAVAIAIFPLYPGVALATIVGVLVEVPVMLIIVKMVNKTKKYFEFKPKIKVAFVCVHNSCRSQIAEALGKHFASDVLECYSAGTEIKEKINPDAVRLVKDIYNIDMEATQYSKLLSSIPEVDIVITMGCNVECPMLPCKYREDWGLDDPSGKPDAQFIDTIKIIEDKIIELKSIAKKM